MAPEVLEDLAVPLVAATETSQAAMVPKEVATAVVIAAISSGRDPVGMTIVTQNDRDIRHASSISLLRGHILPIGPSQVQCTPTSLWFV